ncbi:MAG TPA: hypothetical protein VJ456_15325 [Acidimicrobiia bacterium]|nr:hypothetical protein [Acidimicrobiia bacterium]
MAIAIYFHPQSMSAAQYDEAIKRLDAAGAGNPPGRLHHSAFGPPDQMMVYDVWDSAESFEKFGQTLMPILGEIGLDPGQPAIMPLHNMIQ